MARNYDQDIKAAFDRQMGIIKKQVFLELISVVVNCDTYEEFKKTMYATALGYLKELETEGILQEGTVDNAFNQKQ